MITTIESYCQASAWMDFQQKDAAQKIIRQRSVYAAGLGLLPIPVVDALGVTSLQLWMIRDIANVYGVPFEKHLTKSFIASLAGNLGALSVLKFVPTVGNFLAGFALSLSAAAATYALGRVFMEHFNQGGTLLDFDPVKSREYFSKIYVENEKKIFALKSEEFNRLKTCKEAIRLIAILRKSNKRLRDDEKLYLELLDEADQVINELQETLREQEMDCLKIQRKTNHFIAMLKAVNKNLIDKVETLEKRLGKKRVL